MQLYAAYCGREVEIRQKEWTINDSAWGHDPKDIKFGHVEGRGRERTFVCSNNRYHKTKLCFFSGIDRQTLDSNIFNCTFPGLFPWHMKKRGRNKLSEISNSPRTRTYRVIRSKRSVLSFLLYPSKRSRCSEKEFALVHN
jgi:hypothetical protein